MKPNKEMVGHRVLFQYVGKMMFITTGNPIEEAKIEEITPDGRYVKIAPLHGQGNGIWYPVGDIEILSVLEEVEEKTQFGWRR